MRKAVVVGCVFSLVLSGCAARQAELVPGGTDRDQLAAAIARRGEGATGDEMTRIDQPAPPQSRLDRTVQVVIVYAPYVPACLGLLGVAALYGVARGGPKSSPNFNELFGGLFSSS